MLGYVNELRREVYGTDEYDMVLDDTLLELAKIRAKEISINYSHATDTLTNASENIGGGNESIKAAFIGWRNSTGHYNNMIKQTAKYFAYASYCKDPTKTLNRYVVQLFWTESQKECYW